jgi:hypothetical protein
MTVARFARLIALAGTAACWQWAVAGGGACAGRPLSQVPSVSGLPRDIYGLLGGPEGSIADRGRKFRKTDAGAGSLPTRRFVLAGVSADCVVVALEHGGHAYRIERWVFRRSDSGWLGELQGGFKKPPKSMNELTRGAD